MDIKPFYERKVRLTQNNTVQVGQSFFRMAENSPVKFVDIIVQAHYGSHVQVRTAKASETNDVNDVKTENVK